MRIVATARIALTVARLVALPVIAQDHSHSMPVGGSAGTDARALVKLSEPVRP